MVDTNRIREQVSFIKSNLDVFNKPELHKVICFYDSITELCNAYDDIRKTLLSLVREHLPNGSID